MIDGVFEWSKRRLKFQIIFFFPFANQIEIVIEKLIKLSTDLINIRVFNKT